MQMAGKLVAATAVVIGSKQLGVLYLPLMEALFADLINFHGAY